jgi:EAL domain-containing protein (putative c-di-GMP-specific phosphodiesterase class I)
MEGLGPLRMIYAPIRDGDRVNGLVALGTLGQTHRHHVADDFATVAEFAATAHALLGAQLADDRELSRRRAVIKKVIATSAFYPVFQPIVELESGTTVGFEALTRFIDGTAPALRFAEASMVDLGADLEVATLEAAIMVAPGLPSGVWLSVNVAPQLLLDSERLRSVLARSTRPLVIEITEHEVIRDYREFRQAILDLDGTIRTAVDDAGVGIANFAHIVELRADFVKLDASLIRGINLDHGRQALVAAMHHFTQSAGGQLIAEGIETAAEAGALASLQVRLGQGYFLGPPATIDALARGRATSQKPGGRRPAIAAGKRPKRLRPGAAARSG